MLLSAVLVIAAVSVIDLCAGVPVSKAAARFPAIAKMTADSHPMLASLFASADTAKLNQQQQALKKKQEHLGPGKIFGPGGPGKLPDETSIIGIGADILCKLCQQKNDLECIRQHCWNDGSTFVSKSNTLVPASVKQPPIETGTSTRGGAKLGRLVPALHKPMLPQPGTSGALIIKPETFPPVIIDGPIDIPATPKIQAGVALPPALILNDAHIISKSRPASVKLSDIDNKKGGTPALPMKFSDFMQMDQFKGKQTPDFVPSAFDQPAGMVLPDATANVGPGAVLKPLSISTFDDVAQVAEAAKRDIANIADLERILLGLMDNKPALPATENNMQDLPGNLIPMGNIPSMVDISPTANVGVINDLSGNITPMVNIPAMVDISPSANVNVNNNLDDLSGNITPLVNVASMVDISPPANVDVINDLSGNITPMVNIPAMIDIPTAANIDVNNVAGSSTVDIMPSAVQTNVIAPIVPPTFGEVLPLDQTEGRLPNTQTFDNIPVNINPVVPPAFGEAMPSGDTHSQLPSAGTFDSIPADPIVPGVSSSFGDVITSDQMTGQVPPGQADLTGMMQQPAHVPVSIFPLNAPFTDGQNPAAVHPVLSGSMGQPMFISLGTGNTNQASSAAGPEITLVQGNQNAQPVNNVGQPDVQIQSMRNEHSVASVASAGVPGVFALEKQRQLSEADMFAVTNTTPVSTTPLQTMSPERKEELGKVANMFLPFKRG